MPLAGQPPALVHLNTLTLANPSNLCYLNSLVQALMWVYQARASARKAEFGDLRPMLRQLQNPGNIVQLYRRKAWTELLLTWQHLHQQHDVAELLTYIADHANIPGLNGIWEARSMEGPLLRAHQRMQPTPLD